MKKQPEYLDVDVLPTPQIDGEMTTVTISKVAIEREKQFCEFALIGRLNLYKVLTERLRGKAEEIWNFKGKWMVIPSENGFFMLIVSSKVGFVRIWAQEWKVENQIVRFCNWTPEFDLQKQRTSKALLWVIFPNLQQQCWDYEKLNDTREGIRHTDWSRS